MTVTDKYQKMVDKLQWIAITVLFAVCTIVFIGNKKLKADRERQREETYVKIYESQTIESLRKDNTYLNDSIISLNNYIDELTTKFNK